MFVTFSKTIPPSVSADALLVFHDGGSPVLSEVPSECLTPLLAALKVGDAPLPDAFVLETPVVRLGVRRIAIVRVRCGQDGAIDISPMGEIAPEGIATLLLFLPSVNCTLNFSGLDAPGHVEALHIVREKAFDIVPHPGVEFVRIH